MAKANRRAIDRMTFNQPAHDIRKKKVTDERTAKGLKSVYPERDLRSKVAKERDSKIGVV